MDLSSSSDWNLTFEQTLSGSDLNGFLVPNNFSSQVLAIYISTSASKPTWYTGGYVNQLVSTGLVSDNLNWNCFYQRLLLGGNIVFFPNNLSSYQLQFNFPIWFPNAFLSIWSYTGQVVNSDSIIGQINSTIQDILTLTNNVAAIAQQIANIITIINAIRAIVGA